MFLLKTHCGNAQKWFLGSTLGLLAFGELAYVLDRCIDSWMNEWKALPPEAVISCMFLRKHLLFLMLSIAVGVLLYALIHYWKKHTAYPRRLSVVLGILLLMLNLFSWFAIYCCSEFDRDRIPQDMDIHAELRYIRSKSHWFGRGDHYYTYPDTSSTPDMTEEEYQQMRDVSIRETDKAYYVFGQRSASVLPSLDYGYGKWVSSLYALVAVFWCVGAIIGWKAVRGIWNRVLYGGCFLFLAAQVLGPLLEQLGVLIWPMPVLFSDMDWSYWIVCVAPLFAAMAFLLAEQKTNCETHT